MRRLLLSLDRLESRTVPATIRVTSLADSGAGTLRDALARADALPGKDTIVFKLTPPAGPHIIELASGELTSKGNVTIVGPGAGTLMVSGQGNSRVFDINDGSTTTDSPVAISGMSIISGNASGGAGGGIYSTESLSLTGVVLSGNSAGVGGAIYVAGLQGAKSAAINHVEVFGNSGSSFCGGLDLVRLTSIKLSNSTISGNTAGGGGGGGVYASLGTSGTGMSISGCAVTGNSAFDGGGMALEDLSTVSTAKATVSKCTISGNTATDTGTRGGGGLYLSGGNLAVSGCTISNNTAVYFGGGIEATGFASLTIARSSVTGNQTTQTNAASQGGGGVLIQGAGAGPLVPATISGCTISSNSSAAYGGGAFVTGGVKLTVAGSTFAADRAGPDGGGLAATGTGANQVAVSVTGARFANDSCVSEGGGLFLRGDGPASVVSTKVTGCAALIAGGIFVDLSPAANGFVMTGSTISGNTASSIGGGIVLLSTPDFHISGSSITNNWAAGQGGGVNVQGSSGSILGTTISGNATAGTGGGIVQVAGGTVVLQIAKVHENTAPNSPDTFGTFTDV